MTLVPAPVIALNRAVAVAMVHGPEAGLIALAAVAMMPGIASYGLFHATRATFRAQTGDAAGALASYTAALALAGTEPERRFLRQQRDAIPRPR